MAVTSVSDLNSLFNTIYERAIFVAREQNLMSQLVDQKSAMGWMNRVVPIRPQVSAQSVAETEDFNSPTTFGKSTKATVTPSEIIAQVVLTDRDMETDPDSAVGDASIELGGAVATKIDVDLCALFSSLASDKGTGAGNAATLATLSAGLAVVSYAKARQFGTPNVVLHPYHWHDIWVELGQPAATYANLVGMTEQAIRDYYVSSMLSANWYQTSNIAVDSSDDAVSGIFVRPALMLDTRRAPRLEPERDASARAYELNITAGYGVAVIRSEFGVYYTADASAP